MMNKQTDSQARTVLLRQRAEEILQAKLQDSPLTNSVEELQRRLLSAERRTIELELLLEERNQHHRQKIQFQAQLLYAVGQAVIATDIQGNIIYWNPAAEKLYGWSAGEVLGQSIVEIIAPQSSQEQGKEIMENLTRGESWSGEFPVQRRDGTIFPAHVVDTPIFSESGMLVGIIGASYDITERKQAEAQLLHRNKALAEFHNYVQSVSIVTKANKQGNITYVNDNFVAISGYSQEELIGHNHNIINSGHHPREFWASMWKNISSGKQWRGEVKNKAKNGTVYWVDTFIMPLLDEHGAVYEYLSIRNDITLRKEMQEEILAQYRFIKTVTEALPSMTAYWSSDLRCTFANASYLDWFGKTNEEMIGINMHDLLGEALFAKNEQYIVGALAGERQKFERTLVKSNGEIGYTLAQYIPDISGGRVLGFVAVIMDITEIKKTQVSLAQAQHLAHIGSWELHLATQTMTWSDEEYLLYGEDIQSYTPTFEGYLGYLSKDEQTRMRALVKNSLAEGIEGFVVEHEITLKNGTKRFVVENAVIEYDAQKQPVLMYGTTQDITESKKAKEELAVSERRYRSFVELQSTYFIRTDLEGFYTYANPSMLNDFSPRGEPIIGKHGFTHIIPEDHSKARDASERCLQTPGVPIPVSLRKPHVSGHIYWTEWEFVAITGNDGLVSEVQCVGHNITNRVLAEQLLLQSEEKYRSMVHNIADIITLINAEGIILYESASIQNILGYDEHELLGKHIFEIIHPDDIANVGARFQAVSTNQGSGQVVEFRCLNKRGDYTFLEAQGNNQLDNPAIQAIVVNSRDITQRKKAEQILEQMNETLEQRVAERTEQLMLVDKEKNEFLGIIAHDLKNPLAGIRSGAEIIERYYTKDEGIYRFTQAIINSVDQMLELISSLTEEHRIENGSFTLTFDVIPLTMIDEIVALNQMHAKTKNITLHYECPAESVFVLANDLALRQIVDNLISNAIKYSPPSKQVRIRLLQAETVRIEIQDEGQGLSEIDKKNLFQKFTRLSAKPTAGESSSGLGLFIVKKLVELHHGKIWCESDADQGIPGATFIVEFPLHSQASFLAALRTFSTG